MHCIASKPKQVALLSLFKAPAYYKPITLAKGVLALQPEAQLPALLLVPVLPIPRRKTLTAWKVNALEKAPAANPPCSNEWLSLRRTGARFEIPRNAASKPKLMDLTPMIMAKEYSCK